MDKIQSPNAFRSRCRETTRVSDLRHNALEFLHERKIQMVSDHSDDAQTHGAKPLCIVTNGFAEFWVCQYMEMQLHLTDPIPHLAAMTSRLFFWRQVPQLLRMSPEAERYMDILAAGKLGDGLAMQVYGPNMRNAYLGLVFGGADPDLTSDEIFELQCAAQIAHIRYCEFTEDRQTVSDPLSPRENEILQRIALGKSNAVIGEILGIQGHAVDVMTRRIFDNWV